MKTATSTVSLSYRTVANIFHTLSQLAASGEQQKDVCTATWHTFFDLGKELGYTDKELMTFDGKRRLGPTGTEMDWSEFLSARSGIPVRGLDKKKLEQQQKEDEAKDSKPKQSAITERSRRIREDLELLPLKGDES